MLDEHDHTKLVIEIVVFVITLGGVIWRMATFQSATKKDIERMEVAIEKIEETDARQDNAINRIDVKTTDIDKNLAVVATRTEIISDTAQSISDKLDRLDEALRNK